MCHTWSFKNHDNVPSGYIILGHVLEFYTWIFSIKSLNNPIPKHLKYFHAFVPDCKLNLGNLVPKSALHVIYIIYLISNYISCTVQEYFYFFITWKFCYYCYTNYIKVPKPFIFTQMYKQSIHVPVYELYINIFDIKHLLGRWSKNYTRKYDADNFWPIFKTSPVCLKKALV